MHYENSKKQQGKIQNCADYFLIANGNITQNGFFYFNIYAYFWSL